MKKVYEAPELELIRLDLCDSILASITESSQAAGAGGDMVDPVDPDPLTSDPTIL
jgi:hypothetical protein